MATRTKSELPPSPQEYNSDGYEVLEEEVEEKRQPVNNNVANILERLKSSGASIRKPKNEFYCFTCKVDFPDWEELENHLIQHVSLPAVVLDKLPSDDEDGPPSGDGNWSDDEESLPLKVPLQKPLQKLDISQILKNKGISIKKNESSPTSTSALDKLSRLGLTIKNNTTPIKKEQPDSSSNSVMQKLGKLGGIKLKLKSDGNNANTFKVINGLKDFKASDDEDEGTDQEKEEAQDDYNKSEESNDSKEQYAVKSPKLSDSEDCASKLPKLPEGLKLSITKTTQNQTKCAPIKVQSRGRQTVKQTPTRAKLQSTKMAPNSPPADPVKETQPSTPDRPDSNASAETVIIKKEVNDPSEMSTNKPIFSSDIIKTERLSPPLPDSSSAPLLTKIKTENDVSSLTTTTATATTTTPLLPVTKTEEPVTIIEINGDSNDEDDDCCVVSTTPAPDIKPKVENDSPKIEEVSYPTPSYSTSNTFSMPQSNYTSTPGLTSNASMASTEYKHNYNWNVQDSKPIDMLEKSADDLYDSLLSSGKKESMLSDTSEYISLDKLGTQQTCDVCNTRFTDLSLLDEHRKITGHSQSLVPSTSTMLPYNPSSSLLSSLLPVKQLADQVGKLSTIGNSGPGYTHQQNVMINIQAYPGSAGGMMPQTPYNTFQGAPSMHSNYPPNTNMYGASGQGMPGQYQGENYVGSSVPSYGQYPPQMSKTGYSGTMPHNAYSTAPYATPSPLQGMQQAVYGQSGMLPTSSPSQQSYVPTSSPSGHMKPPYSNSGGIMIQSVQNFPPSQIATTTMTTSVQDVPHSAPGMMPPPAAKVSAGPTLHAIRPRMPGIRPGQRPTIRAGAQIQGHLRPGKISQRMPIKRMGTAAGGPSAKRRSDMLLPGKHESDDCQVMAMQRQREGLPLIQSVSGAKLGSQISITKKTVNKEANAMANVLASRGISVKQKQKSRTPSPERPIPHLPNLGSDVSIKHTSKSTKFSIPEAKVGSSMTSCKICKRIFGSYTSLQAHMETSHPQSKIPVFKCEDCPASYAKSLQLQHHKRVFHNAKTPNKELGLPVVDMSQPEHLKKLSSLGIFSFIPLADREGANSCFGVPVISIHSLNSGFTSSLQGICAEGLLSLGPLKPLPNS
ncbi:unnamed protein product [Leptosia nina]|uniref:C2H2-type domain-containing protein n=1 Tax=Leptosia nina TaxID=320188 RepID=A0AAV1J5T0_9NEOP